MTRIAPVPGFEGLYSITDDGGIYSHGRPSIPGVTGARSFPAKWLKLKTDKDGYKFVCLRKDGNQYTRKVHRLVAEVFIGPPPDDSYVVNHKNLIKDDNRVDNLEWCTPMENSQHAFANGRHYTPFTARWDDCCNSKLTLPDVVEMHRLRRDGATLRHISEKYGVAISTVHSIVSGQTWVGTDEKAA